MPSPGATAVPVLQIEGAPRAELDAATDCLKPLAGKLALPVPRERDTFYKIAFLVVGS
jgi:hypothetical protein